MWAGFYFLIRFGQRCVLNSELLNRLVPAISGGRFFTVSVFGSDANESPLDIEPADNDPGSG